jgi:outer membrane protein
MMCTGLVVRNCTVFLVPLLICAAALPAQNPAFPGPPGSTPRKMTLAEAIDLALKNNQALAVSTARTDEMKSARRKAVADYFPQVSNTSTYTRLTDTDILQFAQGSFGTFPVLGSLPASNLIVKQGDLNEYLVRSQIAQPVTQLLKIRQGERIARADQQASLADLESLRDRTALAVRQIYYGLVAAQFDWNAALEQIRVAEETAAESEQELRRGAILEVSLTEARTRVLEARQEELSVRIRHSDLLAEFNDVAGLPQNTQVEAEQPAADTSFQLPAEQECIRLAQTATPEITAAEEAVKKTEAAVRAARLEYVPDVTVFARHDYQDGVAFLFHNYGIVGAEFKYTFFDGGKKKAAVDEREAQRAEAMANLQRLKNDAAANVEKALDRIELNRSQIDVAKQIADLRTEADRVASVQLGRGVILGSKRSEASAALARSRADLVKAELGYLQSQAELEVLIGRLPR